MAPVRGDGEPTLLGVGGMLVLLGVFWCCLGYAGVVGGWGYAGVVGGMLVLLEVRWCCLECAGVSGRWGYLMSSNAVRRRTTQLHDTEPCYQKKKKIHQ